MWVWMYLFLAGAALWLFVQGVNHTDIMFLSFSALISAILGFTSFHLTYITENGNVVVLSGEEYALAFLWGALLIIDILGVVLVHYRAVRGET